MKSSTTKTSFTPHGGGIRGADVRRQSSLFEGRFGRMFRELPAAIHPKSALLKLGEAMTADAEGADDTPPKPKAALETAAHIQDGPVDQVRVDGCQIVTDGNKKGTRSI